MNKLELIHRLEKAWSELVSSYAGLPGAMMMEAGVTGDWSIKDIIAHVSIWEEEALTHLPGILAGGKAPRYSVMYGGIDAFNALTMAQKKKMSLAAVLRQRDETHQRLIDFLQTVPEEQCNGETRFRRRLRLDTYGHYRKHAGAILRWREDHPVK